MKVLYWAIGLLIGASVLFFAVIYGASELGGEVVTLARSEADGGVSGVRVWIVDSDGSSWIEHGDAGSYWIARLSDDPDVLLTREGREIGYVGVPDADAHALYHRLRREKYGWADQVVGLLGDDASCTGVPVRLQAVE